MTHYIPELRIFLICGSGKLQWVDGCFEVVAKPEQLTNNDGPDELVVLHTEYVSIAYRLIALINAQDSIPVHVRKPCGMAETNPSSKVEKQVFGLAKVVRTESGYDAIEASNLAGLPKESKLFYSPFCSIAQVLVALNNADAICLAPERDKSIREAETVTVAPTTENQKFACTLLSSVNVSYMYNSIQKNH